MNKYRFLFLPLIILAAFSCKNFQTMELTDEHQLALEEPPEKGIPANKYKGGKLFTFDGPINKWWVANSKLSIERVGDTLKVQMKDCGLKYECWGTELDELLDFTESDVLKVTARATGSNSTPALGISLKDTDGNDTSLDRPTNRIELSDEYVEYYYNYNRKWTHWEGKRAVDASGIIEILFFVNPGQMNWTGTIFIDKVEVITQEEMPSADEIKKLRRERRDAKRKAEQEVQPKEEPAIESEDKTNNNSEVEGKASIPQSDNIAEVATPVVVKKQAKSGIVENFAADISNWWKSSDSKIQFKKGESNLTVQLKDVGPAFESFGKNFDRIDFTKTPVLKVKLKNNGELPGDLRIDLKDVNGFVTNSKPNVKVFSTGTDFVDYYFNFTEKFFQEYPNVQIVNPESIIEVVFYVNPGGKAFNGNLTIEEVSTLSLEDFNKVK
jgi:hypothetical protein